MIYLEEIQPFTKRYAEMSFEPLKITAALNSPIVDYGPAYLDSLLARVVVEKATAGRGVADHPDVYWIPLPLKLARLDNLPLWYASAFYPAGVSAQDMVFLQKTVQRGEWTSAKNIQTKTGRWMERRIPTPLLTVERLEARCIGNRAEIETLLAEIGYLGKRRGVGFGEVARWMVEPAAYSEQEIFIWNGALIRALPVENIGIRCEEPPTLVGWTPPQWKSSLYSPGWPMGTPVEIDWFESIEHL